MPEKQTIAGVLVGEYRVLCGVISTYILIAADSVGGKHVPETHYSVLRLVFIIEVRVGKVEPNVNNSHNNSSTCECLWQRCSSMHFVCSYNGGRPLQHSCS